MQSTKLVHGLAQKTDPHKPENGTDVRKNFFNNKKSELFTAL